MQPLLLCTSNSFHVFWFLQGMLGLGRCFWIVSAPERSLRWPLLPLGKWREHYFKTGQLCVITASNNDRLLWSHYKTRGSAKVFIIDQMWESGVCLMSLEGCGIWEERLSKGLPAWAWRPAFHLQNPCQNLSTVAHTSDPSTGESKIG